MIHIRTDDAERNSDATFACGIKGKLPKGDTYFFDSEAVAYHKADCPGCNPGGPEPYGTPISEISGRPGHDGYREWQRISDSWGHP